MASRSTPRRWSAGLGRPSCGRWPFGDRLERVGRELEFDVLHAEQGLILADDGVLGLREDGDERLLVELLKRSDHGQTADELGDQAVLHEVGGLDLAVHLGEALVAVLAEDAASKAHLPPFRCGG